MSLFSVAGRLILGSPAVMTAAAVAGVGLLLWSAINSAGNSLPRLKLNAHPRDMHPQELVNVAHWILTGQCSVSRDQLTALKCALYNQGKYYKSSTMLDYAAKLKALG